MKKRLEAELISIAHRILKLKSKSDVDQLYKETQKLYNTLAVLKFYQDNFESVKSEVSEAILEEKLEQTNEVEAVTDDTKEVIEPVAEMQPEVAIEQEFEENKTEIIVFEEPEQTTEETNVASEENEVIADEELKTVTEEPLFKPIFELEVEEEEEKPEEKLEDHIGRYAEPIFVKPNDTSLFTSESKENEAKEEPSQTEAKPAATLQDAISKSIAIGLNDRIGFVQHLFNDSNEDFNRVISQLNTFDTFEEAKNFINEMVIPDYNYWVGEEDYIERFMKIVEKKFL